MVDAIAHRGEPAKVGRLCLLNLGLRPLRDDRGDRGRRGPSHARVRVGRTAAISVRDARGPGASRGACACELRHVPHVRGARVGLTALAVPVAATIAAHQCRAGLREAARRREATRARRSGSRRATRGELALEPRHLGRVTRITRGLHGRERSRALGHVGTARDAGGGVLHDAERQSTPLRARCRAAGGTGEIGTRGHCRAHLPKVGLVLSERAVRRAQPHRDGHHGRRYENREPLHDQSSA